MARGAAPRDDSSSSSGFSSDEDMEYVAPQTIGASAVPSVAVEVLDEETQDDPVSAPTDSLDAAAAFPGVNQCCIEAVKPILETSTPYNVQYEEYTAAIAHLSWHWPNDDTEKLKQHHALRFRLYAQFQKAFPLTEDMYVQWISDASVGQNREQVKALFELAKKDYWSVTLTLQWLKFLREGDEKQELQRAMKEACSTLGAHFARGHEIWALCRELTTEMLEEEEVGDTQKEKALRELFVAQMQLPLDQNDLAMSEFRAWDAYNTLDQEAAGVMFERASNRQTKLFAPLMKKLRGFEVRVSAAPGTEDAANPEQTWSQYLNFVKHRVAPLAAKDDSGGDLAEGRQIVVCLYERAVATVCLSPSLWASYLEYLEPGNMTGDSSGANTKLAVARRAVRNVSFDSSAWTELLIEMERDRKPFHDISTFVRAELLSRSSPPIMDQFHFLSVLLTWCDIARRHATTSINGKYLEDTVRQVETLVGGIFSECEQFIAKVFRDFVDGGRRLMEYRAKCYWSLMPPGMQRLTPAMAMKVNKIKSVWEDILATTVGEQASAWLSYLEILQRTNAYSVESLREAVFNKAVQRVKDAPLALAEGWLVFERENGDLANYLRARRHHAKISSSTPAPTSLQSTPSNPIAVQDTKQSKAKPTKKRKASAANSADKNTTEGHTAKRAKADRGEKPPTEAKSAKKNAAEKKKAHEVLTNEHTLFLCNVWKDATKEDVEALFKEIPSFKEVRLVVKTRGDRVKSRGMAYVQFTDEAGVVEGLKKNGSLLDGHPVSVEKSKPPPSSASTPGGKPSVQNADPVTLFVGDLNAEKSKERVTEEQLQVALQQAMQAAGELVVVTRASILKDRYDQLKNYGLVEVAEPSQVSFCLANVAALRAKLGEQVTLKPSRFSITHILEQQEKQKRQTQERKAGARAASSKRDPNAPHAKPSTRLALPTGSTTRLMPRSVRRQQAAQDHATAGATKAEPVGAPTVTPKSNEDFRKMLFNK